MIIIAELSDESLTKHLVKKTKEEIVKEYIQLNKGNQTLLQLVEEHKSTIFDLRAEDDDHYKYEKQLRKVIKALTKVVL